MGGAEVAFEDFSAGILGQRVGDDDVFGALVGRQVCLAVREDGVFADLSARAGHDRGDDGFDPSGVGDAEDGDLGDGIKLVDDLFDFATGDVFSPGFDYVFFAVYDAEIAILGEHTEVAGVKPATAERSRGLRLVVPVAEGGLWAAVDDLTDDAREHGTVNAT